ncbi:hypothetical protein GCM10023189_07490 [Nibrella saemangeumensis]|uniref:Uncharacterized protein n=1 Tax=Nibrella saemangeumensis TaxID=1084526 RepID=A0ABP8ME90_9BACT
MKRFWIRRGLRFFAFALLFVTLAGFVIMSLWNALLPTIVDVSAITFWQALGLLVLSRILFGGFRGGGWGGYGRMRHGYWRQRMAERWEKLTPEQRQQMRQQWESRCGRGHYGRRQQTDPQQEEPRTTAI